MKSPPYKEILNILRNIEKEQNRENRHDRLKGMERTIELLTGRVEREEQARQALEKYLKVEYVRESAYKLIK